MRSNLSLLAAAALILPGFALAGHPGPVPEPSYYLSWGTLEAARASGATVLVDYGAFQLVQADPETATRLADQARVEPLPGLLQQGIVSVDPLRQDPTLDAALHARADDPNYVVQFVGPIRPEWVEWLQGYGTLCSYVPHRAFVLTTSDSNAASIAENPMVRYVGPYHAAYKLAPDYAESTTGAWIVQLWAGSDPHAAAMLVEALGGIPHQWTRSGPEPYLLIQLPAERLADLARSPDVAWVEPLRPQDDPHDNNDAAWVTQTGRSPLLGSTLGPSGARLHRAGLSGAGERVAVLDGGIDSDANGHFVHEMFDDPTHASYAFGQENPTHRKVAAYLRLEEEGVIKGDFTGNRHGTHTSGSATGDAPAAGAYGTYNGADGQAFGSRLVVMDWSLLPLDYFNIFDPTYQIGARVSSNSYGYAPVPGTYTAFSRQNDLYAASHPDYVIVRSLGNTATNTMRPEAAAKNVISLGATENGLLYENLADFSSRGPTSDARVKPTLVAPGAAVYSSVPGGGYDYLSGTSMSTPTIAGVAALVREYYQAGWYPDGAPDPTRGFNPSSALVRATLLASTVPIRGANTWGSGLGTQQVLGSPDGSCTRSPCVRPSLSPAWPNGDMGWGIPHLENALALPGDAQGLWVRDGDAAATGEAVEYSLNVTDATHGLKIVLAWTDAAASAGANPSLVNDLDLVVVPPQGVPILGNVFAGTPGSPLSLGCGVGNINTQPCLTALGGSSGQVAPPQSAPGGAPDRRNVEELFVWNVAPKGEYTVRVIGANVPSGPQVFSLVAVGGI